MRRAREYFKLLIIATGERSVFPNVGSDRPRAQEPMTSAASRCFPISAATMPAFAGPRRWAMRRRMQKRSGRNWSNAKACCWSSSSPARFAATSTNILQAAGSTRPAADLLRRSRHRAASARRSVSWSRCATSRWKPAWCSASSRSSTRPAMASACRTRTWWSVTGQGLRIAVVLHQHRHAYSGRLTRRGKEQIVPIKTIAVLGAGHGGVAAAADLTRRGFAVQPACTTRGKTCSDSRTRRARCARRARRIRGIATADDGYRRSRVGCGSDHAGRAVGRA